MADHQRQQRIHPAPDLEASIIPPTTTKSDYPTPPTRTHPVSHSPPPRRRRSRRSCCCRLFCCVFSTLLLLIIAVAATAGILYLAFHPKIPKYSISTLKVTQFSLGSNGSLSATFTVNITAYNPNKHIGIYYLGGSHLSAWYQHTLLCEGGLPTFYQGHRNTTFIDVPLTGTVNNATDLSTRLQQQENQTRNIPLILTGRVPVKAKLGKLKLMKMKFKVRCELSVDTLASNNEVRIGSTSCKIRLTRIF